MTMSEETIAKKIRESALNELKKAIAHLKQNKLVEAQFYASSSAMTIAAIQMTGAGVK